MAKTKPKRARAAPTAVATAPTQQNAASARAARLAKRNEARDKAPAKAAPQPKKVAKKATKQQTKSSSKSVTFSDPPVSSATARTNNDNDGGDSGDGADDSHGGQEIEDSGQDETATESQVNQQTENNSTGLPPGFQTQPTTRKPSPRGYGRPGPPRTAPGNIQPFPAAPNTATPQQRTTTRSFGRKRRRDSNVAVLDTDEALSILASSSKRRREEDVEAGAQKNRQRRPLAEIETNADGSDKENEGMNVPVGQNNSALRGQDGTDARESPINMQPVSFDVTRDAIDVEMYPGLQNLTGAQRWLRLDLAGYQAGRRILRAQKALHRPIVYNPETIAWIAPPFWNEQASLALGHPVIDAWWRMMAKIHKLQINAPTFEFVAQANHIITDDGEQAHRADNQPNFEIQTRRSPELGARDHLPPWQRDPASCTAAPPILPTVKKGKKEPAANVPATENAARTNKNQVAEPEERVTEIVHLDDNLITDQRQHLDNTGTDIYNEPTGAIGDNIEPHSPGTMFSHPSPGRSSGSSGKIYVPARRASLPLEKVGGKLAGWRIEIGREAFGQGGQAKICEAVHETKMDNGENAVCAVKRTNFLAVKTIRRAQDIRGYSIYARDNAWPDGVGQTAEVRYIDERTLEAAKREIMSLSRLSRSPYVCRYIGHHQTETKMYVLMEREEGDLRDLLAEPGFNGQGSAYKLLQSHWTRKTRVLWKVWNDVLRGLAAVHHEGIVHMDIKFANILYSRNKPIEVADGSKKKTGRGAVMTVPGGGKTKPGASETVPQAEAPAETPPDEEDDFSNYTFKLADFGACRKAGDVRRVVSSDYYMAPEQANMVNPVGAHPGFDMWSLFVSFLEHFEGPDGWHKRLISRNNGWHARPLTNYFSALRFDTHPGSTWQAPQLKCLEPWRGMLEISCTDRLSAQDAIKLAEDPANNWLINNRQLYFPPFVEAYSDNGTTTDIDEFGQGF